MLKIKLLCYIIDSMEAGKGRNMAADWDNPQKKKIDKNFVSCEEEYEIDSLAKKYKVSKDIVKECCKKSTAPHHREDIEQCIEINKRLRSLLS